jgi:ABC-type Mn2+/Zn2+ transport system permease subunit
MSATLLYSLLTIGALALACGVLSVLVVLRRWAFIGEGISHSTWGGAGVVWLLSLAFPLFEQSNVAYFTIVCFSLLAALLIGWLSRNKGVSMDAAIGIFLVGSLAWGFMAQQLYTAQRHATPVLFENLLFGRMLDATFASALMTVAVCSVVMVTTLALSKEILAYCFDPLTAHTSGVPGAFIHYLLLGLIAVLIVVGVRVAGSVLVTALLILPGAAALLLTRRLGWVVVASVVVSCVGALGGFAVHWNWRPIPVGPAMVLCLLLQFAGCFVVSRLRRFS